MNRNVTGVDFSKHELKVTELDGATIYDFNKPNTRINGLTFINARGVCTVTGDFGNWVFCREFHPSPGEGVSRGYWDEKLRIASEQKSHEFDSDETNRLLGEFKNDFEDYIGRPMNDEEQDWYDDLCRAVFDKTDYIHVAYRENPSTIDYEYVPFGEKRHVWLEIVYDAFNAMCDQLEE